MNSSHVPEPGERDIAIVGIAVRFPEADTIEAFRHNMRTGRDSVRPMPAERAAATGLDPSANYLPMGHLDDIHTFDSTLFGLSRREAAVMDPQQRLALLLAHQAFEDAGYASAGLRGADTAVVFSSSASTYDAAAREPGALSALGNAPFGLPSRIAHVLGLTGPCYAVDSGCNSSLVAVHHACRELLVGDAEYAVAGGVSVKAGGMPASALDGLRETAASDVRYRSYDADADGAIGGEGGAALLLTTVDRALADGAPVHAVIRGSAVLHSGRASATMSAPSARAQARVVAKAWAAAGLDPVLAGYLEGHGSGTPLGDAVELEGLASVFGTRPEPLPIGSVKANIGHLDAAAGMAGLLRAVLSVRHGELYPTVNYRKPTGGVDLGELGLEVLTAARPWAGAGRLAGVSSFSLGGINAHCVVQQPPEPPRRAPAHGDGLPRVVAVSARTHAALRQLCADLAGALREGAEDLADVAFTLNHGRAAYEHRVAVTARDTRELATQLAAQATWLGEAPDRPSGRRSSPKVVLLLSPDAVPPGAVPQADRTPASSRDGSAAVDTAEVLSRQRAAYEELRRCGVRIAGVVSTGESRKVAAQLPAPAGKTAEEVPSQPDASEQGHADAERSVRELAHGGPVVFVELAPDSTLGTVARRHVAAAEGSTTRAVVSASERTGGFPELLCVLYGLGVNVDWHTVSPPPAEPLRLRLPGHPVRGTHCWLEPESHAPPPAAPETRQPAPTTGDVLPGGPPSHGTATERDSVGTGTGIGTGQSGGSVESGVSVESVESVEDVTAWLCRTLEELLRTESRVEPAADYLDLGWNSIIGMQLIDRVEGRYNFRPKLIDTYDHSRVEDFAKHISAHVASGTGDLPPVRPQPKLVLSYGQERMWFHHQLDEGTTLYNLPSVNHIRADLDIDAVRGMWEDLAGRHEVLRSRFVEVDGAPELRVSPGLTNFFRYEDLSGHDDPLPAARELIREAADHRFDLAADDLLRVLVVRLAPRELLVQVTMHHAVSDGASPRIFERELPELYDARREGRPPRLDPLPLQFRDYAQWQRDLLATSALDSELAYWRTELTGVEPLRLPTDHPRPARKSYRGNLLRFDIPDTLAVELRQAAARQSTSVFVVLLAALYLLLARYSGQRDLVVGTPTTGRTRPELQGLVGFFNSTVALRASLAGEPTLDDFVSHIRERVLTGLDNQNVPFDRVVKALVTERDPSRAPLFDVMFVHQDLPPLQRVDGHVLGSFDDRNAVENLFGGLPAGTAKFDLTLVTGDREGEDGISACLEYSTDLFTEDTAAEMTAVYTWLLGGIAAAGSGSRPLTRLLDGPPHPAGPAPAEPPASDGTSVRPPDHPELLVPADRPRPEQPVVLDRVVTLPLEPRTYDRLTAAGHGGQQATVLLACWLVLLSWVTGQDEVAVAAPGGPARAAFQDDPTLGTLLTRLAGRGAAPGAGGQVGTTAGPLPRVCCTGAWDGESVPGAYATELAFSWDRQEDGALTLRLDYASALFTHTTANTLLTATRELLDGLLDEPGLPVHDVLAERVDLQPEAPVPGADTLAAALTEETR
ncbi:polyketide synthase [Streptomyces armeniacus]|uniref:Polyketide synthase n=1 Tax=Streptomyces armeniacus TaxID=83291 RepID=A0A345XJ65_9ACTN|nr:condensation domain-containing protein [Streptomyces armeniacus]AXK31681.1 polyketide synthase [Streptomyces armeniacus]